MLGSSLAEGMGPSIEPFLLRHAIASIADYRLTLRVHVARSDETTNYPFVRTTRPENVDGQSVPVKSASIRVA